jgi:lysophospholipase L1-like esterase
MRKRNLFVVILSLQFVGGITMASGKMFVTADHPYIQYYGRWDRTDALHPKYSWPGVYLSTEFSGTSIGVLIQDSTNYYNVYIDGAFHSVFHPAKSGESEYALADNLEYGHHSLLLSRRNITFDEIYTFYGIVLDEGEQLLPPKSLPARRIEFIGDSFTAGESNETTEQSLAWEARYPVTNIDKGFAVRIAHHFQAQYMLTCRSGSGMVCDWRGDPRQSIPIRFNRTFMDSDRLKWDFKQWIPDVVVICLGLNDHSGLKDSTGQVSAANSELFRSAYHKFIDTVRSVYPLVRLVAVAAFPEWIRKNVRQVVDEEIHSGKNDIHYTQFDEFPGGYVGNGHPTVETHQKMADQLIGSMESFHLFEIESK